MCFNTNREKKKKEPCTGPQTLPHSDWWRNSENRLRFGWTSPLNVFHQDVIAPAVCDLHNYEIPICFISKLWGRFFVIVNYLSSAICDPNGWEKEESVPSLLWIIPIHLNSFLTGQVTPPHPAIRGWTQLLIAGRLNPVCHQIPVWGRDGDVVQRATRPPHRQRLTPTEASSRKWQQTFSLKPEASPLSALSLLLPRENWLGGNLEASCSFHPKQNCV